jgi:hypothetical protein
MGVMGARLRRFGLMVMSCVLVCVLGVVATSASAAPFGSWGSEAEQLETPSGVAVDATGNVYVGDLGNNRVDKWDGSGSWLSAWGAGVADGAATMQVCTEVCRSASQTSAPEALELPTGVAVDNDPLSSSYGDVYVVDAGHSRVEKFTPSGSLLLMFGGKVNAESAPVNQDVCEVGEKCNLYAETGTANGEFSPLGTGGRSSFIAVGSDGAVYVGDKARVEVFEPSGAWKEDISLAGLSTEARPTALAVDNSGNIFVKDAGVTGVRELEPNGTEKAVKFDEGSAAVTALAVDTATGGLFVGDSSGGFHINQYDANGKLLASFGAGTVSGENRGLAFSSATGEVYASDAYTGFYDGAGEPPVEGIWAIPVPPQGPLVDSQSATPELRGAATLEAHVNPEGSETTVHFEYVDDAHFKESGFTSATSTTPVLLPSGFEDQLVSTHLTLVPGTVYRYRVVASSAQGTDTSVEQSFQEIPPAQIVGPSAENVASTSATIGVSIDPLGAHTTYRLEVTNGSDQRVLSGDAGEGMSYVKLTRHVQELQPATTYRVRVVTSNEVGTWQSEASFITQAVASELTLPDGRAWEMVTPVDKRGARFEPEPTNGSGVGYVEAASDGHGLAYEAREPVTENPRASVFNNAVIAQRGPSGWSSQEFLLSEKLTEEEHAEVPSSGLGDTMVSALSSDLSGAVVEPSPSFLTPLGPEAPGAAQASERTLYLHDNADDTYLPLVTSADVPAGTAFGGNPGPHGSSVEQQVRFIAATPDLSHVLFASPLRLTPEAVEGSCVEEYKECETNIFEWSGGHIELVSILPNGEPLPHSNGLRSGEVGRSDGLNVVGALSNDGRRVVWAASVGPYSEEEPHTSYVRDMVEGKTEQFGGQFSLYEGASADGSRVFYLEHGELYVFEFANDTTTQVTASHLDGEVKAGVIDGFIMNASEDGSRIYYAASGVLAPGAIAGEPNLYLSHYDGSSWKTSFVATLSKADDFSKFARQFFTQEPKEWHQVDGPVSRASHDGRYLAFMSNRSLTGYDNLDAVSGEADEEVYLYDATTGALRCVSCNPTGARPIGIYVHTLVSYEGALPLVDVRGFWGEHWLAGFLPQWHKDPTAWGLGNFATFRYQPRYLSDSGRMFFDSSDALVPQDTNGLMDVYEYEPSGVGGCSSDGVTFSSVSQGCADLISSGTSSEESAFMDASENGDDAFFVTNEKLVLEDVDTTGDVYDAHVCTTAVPCHPAPVVPPACTTGDSCKSSPSPQPELFGPSPSETFNGTGNVSQQAAKPKPKSKPRACGKGRQRKHGKCVLSKPRERGHKQRAVRRGGHVVSATRTGKRTRRGK